MKNLINFLFLIISLIGTQIFAQELKYSDLSGDERPRGDFTSYVSKDGAVYKIGDKITIGVPSSNKTFAFISQGDGILIDMTPLKANSSGESTEIKRIEVGGFKRTGYYVFLRCKGSTAIANYSIQLENAIATGEVKSFGMTSDEALAELKRAKDKLELGIITQAEYDSIKENLVKYIK